MPSVRRWFRRIRKSGQSNDENVEVEYYPKPVHRIRAKEFPLLNDTTYLDHAGTTIYPQSLIGRVSEELQSNLFGNPHSQSPSSTLSTLRIEKARSEMLAFFNADQNHFDLIFVANATAAIKLVAECLRDYSLGLNNESFWYGYYAAAHSSLVGVRELAKPGSRCFVSDQEVECWLSDGEYSTPVPEKGPKSSEIGLFAYPAQSNFNGRRLPLDWASRTKRSPGSGGHNMFSLLDAAALVATAPLDLSDPLTAPDFTTLSFYKIFGIPDLGGLIVRKDSGHSLRARSYFGGGTVDMIINGGIDAWHAKKQNALHEILEDGTPAFHSIIALEAAVQVHTALYGRIHNVSKHTGRLCKVLYDRMSTMRHYNENALCRIYNDPNAQYGQAESQGPTIAFNILTATGAWVRKSDFESLAIVNGIQLRTGGVCNPGGIAWALDLTPSELKQNYTEGLRCGNGIDELNGKPTGIIRVSLGAMSNIQDVNVLLLFLRLFVETSPSVQPVPVEALQQTEEESCYREDENPNLSHIVLTEGLPQLRCPVAACGLNSHSEDVLAKHFQSHRIPTIQKIRRHHSSLSKVTSCFC